ncbi:hypothetical protein AFA_10345 [Alcaligenes faecalis]|uniref:TRAP transporter small permease protein n=2 Tax=Alcaligenes TaxID=507 RepID=A0AB33CTB1_ALCFA|nr:hypothetical protein AFA_10345 [Alcaligenes faecalis]HBQ88322.1 TRAP transporter small permease [Alcaligenes faecalis]
MCHPHVPTPQVKVMTTNNVPTKTENWADKSASVIEKALDWIIGSMMFVMCAVIAWQIFSRYVLKDMSSWSEEVARFLMVWISLLGSAAVLRRGGHVTVTILLDYLSSKLKRRVLIIRDLLMLATLLSMTYYGWEFAQINAVQLSAAMDIPMSWVYASLWLGMGLCVVILLLIRLGSQSDWTSGSTDEHP